MEAVINKVYTERNPKRLKRFGGIAGGILLLLLAVLIGISCGVADLSWQELRDGLFFGVQSENYRIVYLIRMPRVFCGILAGTNLALAGCILQGILRNPLADPGIIGVTAGAGLFAMVIMIILPEITNLVPIAAFIGAMVAVAIVFYSDRIQSTINWMAGGFQGASWSHVSMILPYTLLGLAAVFFISRWLNALQLGEDTARSIGLPVEKIRFVLLILAALLAASAVSVAGMLGFVGLVIPHMVRLVTGSDFDYLLPCSAIWGAAFVSMTDSAARLALAPIEVPVGVFMSFFGAPFFLYLLKKGMKSS